MKRPRRRLRTRLTVAMLAIALGVLVVTAGITASLARRTATDAARKDLQEKAPEVASALTGVFSGADQLTLQQLRERLAGTNLGARVKRLVETTLTVSDGAVIALDANGEQQEILGRVFGAESSLIRLPDGVSADDLDTKALLAGEPQTGRDGNTVFVAQPLPPVRGGLTPVVVLAKQVETRPFGQDSGLVLVAALGAIVVAAVVATYLARRMTRPLAAMETTAGMIAGGDLSARVDLRDMPRDELGELAEAINTMGEELQAARGHERAFLLSVSHDLRTPLTSIRGYAQAIADGTIDERDAQLHAAEVISAESRRLQRLVADLLDLARLDAHQFSLSPRAIDARDVVAETVDAFRPQADDIGLSLEVTFAGDDHTAIWADPERLGQIVANLVENALKFATTSVTVALQTTDEAMSLTVDDDGPGISPDDVPHVFERLYASRTVPGRAVGTGIGLAIVRELAIAMGGETHVETIDARGTRFVVTIPAAAPPGPHDVAPAGTSVDA